MGLLLSLPVLGWRRLLHHPVDTLQREEFPGQHVDSGDESTHESSMGAFWRQSDSLTSPSWLVWPRAKQEKEPLSPSLTVLKTNFFFTEEKQSREEKRGNAQLHRAGDGRRRARG